MAEAGKPNNKELLNRTLLTDGGEMLNEPLDLTNCEKEPIHIPGSIQPHGVLLAVSTDNFTIIQSSMNTGELLGIAHEDILGKSLKELIPEQELDHMVRMYRNRSVPSALDYMQVTIHTPEGDKPFFAIMHDSDNTLILELEPGNDEAHTAQNDFEWIQSFFNMLKQTSSRVEASQVTADQLRLILGYDRVMVYEFDGNWNGKVIAEAKKKGLEPFLGHHYPASDIPRQARELYLRNWLRLIVDVSYRPVPILPVLNPQTGQPLNLSLSTLRSVSPLHLEYLHNMGVQATMTISLIHEGKLWGLITCHHNSVKYIPHRIRNLCNFLGVFFSGELYQRQQLDNYQEEIELKTKINRLSGIFIGSTTAEAVIKQLIQEESVLLDVMKSSGAAVCYQGELTLFGAVPGVSEVEELAKWLSRQAQDNIYHTSSLSQEYKPAKTYKHLASGVMYTALSTEHSDYIIWFRPEVVQIVDWAGDPAKAVIQENDSLRLSPRKSFEKWRQVVESTSLPWRELEIRVIPDFNSVLLKRTEQQLLEAEEKAMLNQRIIKENEKRYMQLMDISSAAFFTLTGNKIVYCNDRAAELFRAADNTEIIGKGIDELFRHEHEAARLLSELERLEYSAEQLSTVNETLTAVDGTELNVELTAVQVQLDDAVSYWIIVRDRAEAETKDEDFTDITDQLQTYMNMDPLTDIPNRQYFEKSLYLEWEQCLKTGDPVCLMMLDIDNFKVYNTMQGFQGGDLILQWVADVLGALSTEYNAFIARYSGGTFALYLTGTPQDETVELADKIRQAVSTLQMPADLLPDGNPLTVSIGVACMIPTLQRSHAKLIRQAEKALASAKRAGKNRVVQL
ncbi:phytochrome Cph1 [Paenibacillus sp. PK3_47]|uniref:sensor domain-containing diguanylate cyclase n=1 Tax=Paenibacillus sp. PK3_47 TaxID=2072642 RepID=UPI00201E52CC|nr:sensor domain-containing diguanylate cyclase [Paenibacillus sp. PK3_47]UQZ37009.1 phytochrome Cph1 [Paenibacillus sp. PK3_47]